MVSEGDRIELVHTDDPYTNLEPGDKGTVTGTDVDSGEITPSGRPEEKVWVDWDDGGQLALIVGEDRFNVVDEDDEE